MKTLLIASVIALSSLNAFADSESTLKACLSKTYASAAQSNGKTKDITKFVSTNVKACKDSVRATAKAEKDAKRKSKIADQIKKLQAKLSVN